MDVPSSDDSEVRNLIHNLQHPVSDFSTLLSLITAPLDCLSLLPPNIRRYNVNPLPSSSVRTSVHIPLLQRALLQHILPIWDSELKEQESLSVLDQYFCPDLFLSASSVAGDIAVIAYATIISLPFTDHSIRLLTRLSKEYPLDRLHSSIFSRKDSSIKLNQEWEDCIQNVVAVPAKVGNYCGTRNLAVPASLEHGKYFNNLSVRCEALILTSSQEYVTSINVTLTKLVKLGVFPPRPPSTDSQPSFFHTTLPIVRSRLSQNDTDSYSSSWSRVFRGFESSFALQHVLASLFDCLNTPESSTDCSPLARASVKREAFILNKLCPLGADDDELWQAISAVVLGREWKESMSRVFVCWIAECDYGCQFLLGCNRPASDPQYVVLRLLLDDVASLWSNPEHIKHSLISLHRYVTSILLLTISYFPPSSPELVSLVLSADFINGISVYISSMDNAVRHCGMLVAEVAAQRAGKSLDFKDWDGDDSGKPWARSLRALLADRDADADMGVLDEEDTFPDVIVSEAPRRETSEPKKAAIIIRVDGYDSDDSVTGYDSLPSSRSNSPTLSELEDIEKDPSLNVGRKTISRPVYLAQLGAMLRSTGGMSKDNPAEEADKIEVALNCAEELIRKKKNYGTELEENAVNLAYGLVGLQDNYNLDRFNDLRQNALNALVACSPRKAAPCAIEEFFKNQYSTDQRYAILNALALGARELASLPIPPSVISRDATSFPSKRLPAPLHQKYLPQTAALPQILSGITREAIERGKDAAEDKVPQIVRERRFRVQPSRRISEVDSATSMAPNANTSPPKHTTFNEVAAEYFIAPLINRFWLFLRDEQTREERTAYYEGRAKYHGTGTGLILNPLVITHFLRTLTVLAHASQHTPEWLGFIAPDSLELALTLGTKPMSVGDQPAEGANLTERGTKEASVLASALELAVIILDGCTQLDGGRALSLDHTALLMGVSEWASVIFSKLDEGIKIQGGGGGEIGLSLRRAASGVILKVDEILSKYRRSMIDTW
ncbi:telomere length regulation protein-domain-containing protein [Lentinula boryana]|uniref:Telomere length regulation protein-domain-containing protein n=1 Tax=Lentinula boryana TaxID=40481 RepID=A0ABQ8QSB3_9AGAR|nr:telomere length regulation protein-domain-containing protein [Lentinula boryana]